MRNYFEIDLIINCVLNCLKSLIVWKREHFKIDTCSSNNKYLVLITFCSRQREQALNGGDQIIITDLFFFCKPNEKLLLWKGITCFYISVICQGVLNVSTCYKLPYLITLLNGIDQTLQVRDIFSSTPLPYSK